MTVSHANRWSQVGRVFTGFFFSLALAPQALAETVWNGEVFGDWRFECAAHADGVTQCALVQTIIDTGTDQPMLRLSFAKSAVDGIVTASVLLPLGVDLAESAKMHFGADEISLPYRICLVEGCLARKEMAPEDLQRLATADSMDIQFYAVGRSAPVQAPASARGLSEAFGRLAYVAGK